MSLMTQSHSDPAQPPFKRLCVPSSTSSDSSAQPTCPSSESAPVKSNSNSKESTPLLQTTLGPIRSLLHLFFTDWDAALILRASRTTARALLSGYTFRQHLFKAKDKQHLSQMTALYERYDMRMTRMKLPIESVRDTSWTMSLQDTAVPKTVTILSICSELVTEWFHWMHSESMFGVRAAALLRFHCRVPWDSSANFSPDFEEESDEQRCERLCRRRFGFFPSLEFENAQTWIEHPSLPVPPSSFFHGVRILEISHKLTSPLPPGSIPPTVLFLQLSGYFHPLVPGVLPPSLLHLVISNGWPHPLPPGALPPHLETLTLTCRSRKPVHPLNVHSLPSSLRMLTLFARSPYPLFPGPLPSGLLHLELRHLLRLPSADAFPKGLLTLHLAFDEPPELVQELAPLPIGYFPSSLKDLDLGPNCAWPLLPGTLPQGLRFLCIRDDHSLEVGVLPSALLALDVCGEYHAPSTWCLPVGLRYLSLPVGFDVKQLQVSPTTKIIRL